MQYFCLKIILKIYTNEKFEEQITRTLKIF